MNEIYFENGKYAFPDMDEALALADAIYLAAGRLPKVEDWSGSTALDALSRQPLRLVDTPFVLDLSEYAEALDRLQEYGFVTRDGDDEFHSLWHITPAGRKVLEDREREA